MDASTWYKCLANVAPTLGSDITLALSQEYPWKLLSSYDIMNKCEVLVPTVWSTDSESKWKGCNYIVSKKYAEPLLVYGYVYLKMCFSKRSVELFCVHSSKNDIITVEFSTSIASVVDLLGSSVKTSHIVETNDNHNYWMPDGNFDILRWQ